MNTWSGLKKAHSIESCTTHHRHHRLQQQRPLQHRDKGVPTGWSYELSDPTWELMGPELTLLLVQLSVCSIG